VDAARCLKGDANRLSRYQQPFFCWRLSGIVLFRDPPSSRNVDCGCKVEHSIRKCQRVQGRSLRTENPVETGSPRQTETVWIMDHSELCEKRDKTGDSKQSLAHWPMMTKRSLDSPERWTNWLCPTLNRSLPNQGCICLAAGIEIQKIETTHHPLALGDLESEKWRPGLSPE